MRSERKTRWLHDDRICFRILWNLNRKTDFTCKKKIQKILIDHSKAMKKNEKTNDEMKNYNDFDVFKFKSTIRKCDFYRFNNSFEDWFWTHNKTTHRAIVRRRFVNWRFNRSVSKTKSKTFVRCEQHNIVRSKHAKSKSQIFIASNDELSIIRNKLKKSLRSKSARC